MPQIPSSAAAGLMEFDVSDTRKVLVALSEGVDHISVVRPELIGAAASALKVQLVFMGSTPRLLQSIRYSWPNSRLEETPRYANRFRPLSLSVLASDSGGQVIDLENEPAEIVSRLLKRLRSGYLISDEGTNAAGWHAVSVTVRKRGARVAARAL
jgi:hypothetical protein